MAFKKIPLTIDTMIRNPVPIEGINQEDNIELNIVVTENKTPKDLSSQTIKVYVRRIDGTLVEQTNQITPTNARKGEVTVKLKNSAFNKEGYALFQLDVSDSIGRITSSYATFKIGKGLVSSEAIANTNEIEALKKVEEYIKKANQELETFKKTVAEINENEATRQENEVVRVRGEESRNEAEVLRGKAEATREGRLKALETEVANARTATTNENFHSLDERIDAEVDRLKKKIEVTMLEQSDVASHSIENSLEGMTTDMVVKGKTMYKKADGSFTDTWEEGVTIESFGEQEGNKISILSYSKNIWNNVNINIQSENSALIEKNETGFKITRKITGDDHFGASCIIKLKPRTQYTISSNKSYSKSGLDSLMYIYDDMLFGNKLVSGNEPLTFTTSSNGVAVIGFYFRGAMWKPNDFIVYTNIQLEENSKQSKFENYKKDKKDILLPFEGGLKSVGSVADELVSNTKKAIERIGKRAYQAGDESLENVITDKTNTYYILDQAIERDLQADLEVNTYQDKTYVSIENSLPGALKFKAPVDTTATITHLSRENKTLEEENMNLRQNLESTAVTLENSDLELVKQNVDMDFRLMEVEFALDIPQSTLSSNINFKKKGEVKRMARTPYEMMKIVILSGDYDREDYIHKVGKYYERRRMTKEEYDELMSLMTADEVIGE